MTFLLSEDKALRDQLLGMLVSDQKADNMSTTRQVGVFYGQPDQELRTQNYPYVTIDMIDIQRDVAREHRGIVTVPNYMDSSSIGVNQGGVIHLPIPVSIDYQVTTFARHPRHDRELISQIMTTKLPTRFGTLSLDDNTVRRMDVMDISKRDMTESGKRLFSNSITVRVSSEVVESSLRVIQKALSVHIDYPNTTNAGERPGDPTFTPIGTSIITG